MKKAVRTDIERKEKFNTSDRVTKMESEEVSDKPTKDVKRIAKLEGELDEVKQHQGRLYRQYGCVAGTSTISKH